MLWGFIASVYYENSVTPVDLFVCQVPLYQLVPHSEWLSNACEDSSYYSGAPEFFRIP